MGKPPAEISAIARLEPNPCRIKTRRARCQERLVDEVLVEWRSKEDDFTWKECNQIKQRYSYLHALGQAYFKGGGFVVGLPRTRTSPKATGTSHLKPYPWPSTNQPTKTGGQAQALIRPTRPQQHPNQAMAARAQALHDPIPSTMNPISCMRH